MVNMEKNGMYRRVALGAALSFLCVLSLCGVQCGREETAWRPGMPMTKDKIKIGVLYVDRADGGYSLAHETGVRRMRERLGLSEDQIIAKFDIHDSDAQLADHVMRECIAVGANVIVATSWGYMDACEKLAGEFPGVVFAHASGYKRNDTNLTNYFGRVYLARYLSGIVAGMATKSGKIGYVAARGRDNSEVTGGVNAFALGVESVNPEAKVYVRVTNSWYDPAGERQATVRLAEAGCDVVSQHCDTPEPQLQAEKLGILGIGYNSDMYAVAPKAVLTSVIWNWDVYYTALVQSVIDGTFTTAPYFGGLREGFVSLTPLAPKLTVPAMEEAVLAARTRMFEDGFNVFDGELRTNDGRVVGKPGATLTDGEITGGIDWYYHTVEVL